ncbi:hypothetical protein SteCoe_4484 [Stentor coeruleus]|uniref:Uncharacterized protein n=1 Tax=Stentor coeruleus TaxID=5963 RepID=A0A1R2CUU2_9CILI|nr:hypothetical protein SteCoe_4484 [Stentor coeruleus]
MSSSSLTFCDQHLAWQQRVSKEINAAARLYESFQTFPASRKTAQSSQHFRNKHRSTSSVHSRHEKKSLNDSVNSINAMKNYLNTGINVYAEVRGKYARPAPQLNQAVTNPVLNRPTTAGSLRARSCRTPLEPRIQEYPIQKPENLEELRRKSHSSLEKSQRSVSRRSNSRTRHVKLKTPNHPIDQETKHNETMLEKVQDRIRYLENASKSVISEENKLKTLKQPELEDQTKKSDIQDDISKEKLSNIESLKKQIKEKKEDLKDLEDLLRESPEKNTGNDEKDFDDEKSIGEGNKEYDDTCKSIVSTSRSSWKTTSSQRRYIQELESLLREEKLRRMKLEEVLNTIISK